MLSSKNVYTESEQQKKEWVDWKESRKIFHIKREKKTERWIARKRIEFWWWHPIQLKWTEQCLISFPSNKYFFVLLNTEFLWRHSVNVNLLLACGFIHLFICTFRAVVVVDISFVQSRIYLGHLFINFWSIKWEIIFILKWCLIWLALSLSLSLSRAIEIHLNGLDFAQFITFIHVDKYTSYLSTQTQCNTIVREWKRTRDKEREAKFNYKIYTHLYAKKHSRSKGLSVSMICMWCNFIFECFVFYFISLVLSDSLSVCICLSLFLVRRPIQMRYTVFVMSVCV